MVLRLAMKEGHLQRLIGFHKQQVLAYLRHQTSSSFIIRTIIDLEDSQASQLDVWAKAEKISCAEAVRRHWAQVSGCGHKASQFRPNAMGWLCSRLCVMNGPNKQSP